MLATFYNSANYDSLEAAKADGADYSFTFTPEEEAVVWACFWTLCEAIGYHADDFVMHIDSD